MVKISIFDLIKTFYPMCAALFSMCVAQGFKVAYGFYKHKSLSIKYAFLSGGMPSSHSALVTSLTLAVGWQQGWASAPFAISVVFSAVVLYDAAGVRRAVGRQGEIINRMIDKTYLPAEGDKEKIKEVLGHTPTEVIFGVLLGASVATLLHIM